MDTSIVNPANINPVSQKKSGSGFLFTFITVLLLGFLILLLLFLIQYVRTSCPDSPGKKTFVDYILSLDPTTTPCKPAPPVKEFKERVKKKEEEVFHIGDQIYTYPEAQEKCKAYGAKLATHQQLIDAYNNGAEWTSYGWSEGQRAFYPIQPCSFVELRRKGVMIGPPGVNGGKFQEQLRFGANCYGIKPTGHVSIPKDPLCKKDGETEICRNNPDACKVSDNDRIDPFIRDTQWSKWGDS